MASHLHYISGRSGHDDQEVQAALIDSGGFIQLLRYLLDDIHPLVWPKLDQQCSGDLSSQIDSRNGALTVPTDLRKGRT
ncbi:MAG: hypothetical protein CME06_07135 [Gemmatimonadetes bacterium]|nr:hypothetical protein [Gemmatimonadota bacterium]